MLARSRLPQHRPKPSESGCRPRPMPPPRPPAAATAAAAATATCRGWRGRASGPPRTRWPRRPGSPW
eukprot:1602957-Alexandrium_andersonii.AAC.1